MKFRTFCAANSGEGFFSFFDTILNEQKNHIYYIKGGPGSGKSTLMKHLAEKADTAELIYCSGDPSSLDGVIFPEQSTVVIDATAPHSHEPKYPGVGGEIVDLGIGWEPEKLDKDILISLMEEKKEIYNSCYAVLKSAQSIHKGIFIPLDKHINSAKYKAAADKIMRQNALWEKRDNAPIIQHRFLSAISPDGCLMLNDTFTTLGRNIIVLEDRWMIGHLFISYLAHALREKQIDHIIAYHPLLGKNFPQHIIIPEANLSIITKDGLFPIDIPEENIIHKITMQSMLDKAYLNDHKNKLSFIKKMERELLQLACEKLSDARAVHMQIEAEYAKGINYNSINFLNEKLKNIIFPQT